MRTGRPEGVAWPRYDTAARSTLVVGTRLEAIDDPRGDERAAWGEQDWLASTWYAGMPW